MVISKKSSRYNKYPSRGVRIFIIVIEIRTKTTVYFGVGAINKMTDIAIILAKQGINKVVVVTGKGSHIKSGAWAHVEKAVPIIAINLTHGTGTEADRFAVVSIPGKEYKPAIAYDCLYPMYSINDPGLMTTLPADQTAYVSIDAVNHVIEAATTKLGNPFAISPEGP